MSEGLSEMENYGGVTRNSQLYLKPPCVYQFGSGNGSF